MARTASPTQHPLCLLGEEDLEMVMQFVLASGSLKELAKHYDVSYPTLRLILDRLIDRVRSVAKGTPPDPMNHLLADLLDRGEVSVAATRRIRELYRRQVERSG